MQAGNITTNLKVKADFTLPSLSATNVVTCKYYVYESSKGRYDMILGRYLLTESGLNLKFSEHVIKADDGHFKGSTAPVVDLGTYKFKDLNTGKIKPEESFTDDYVKEVYNSEHIRNATKILHVIIYAKYEKAYLNKVMETQCQHLTMTKRNEFMKALYKYEEFFYGTLVTCKIYPVDFELKKYTKPICSQKYPVMKLNEEMFKN